MLASPSRNSASFSELAGPRREWVANMLDEKRRVRRTALGFAILYAAACAPPVQPLSVSAPTT
jgi:hypothetical protein